MRSLSLTGLALILVALPCLSEERFGDFSKHRLRIKLEPVPNQGKAGDALTLKLPGFLMLEGGRVYFGRTESDVPFTSAEVAGNQIEFYYLSFTAPGQGNPALADSNVVRFRLLENSWAADDELMVVSIPYSVDDTDKKQMIKFSDRCTVEVYDREPKGGVATILFNPMAWPFIVKAEAKCIVLESTLGYKNILQ